MNTELRQVQSELRRLREREEELKTRKEFLTDALLLLQSKEAGQDGKWESNGEYFLYLIHYLNDFIFTSFFFL